MLINYNDGGSGREKMHFSSNFPYFAELKKFLMDAELNLFDFFYSIWDRILLKMIRDEKQRKSISSYHLKLTSSQLFFKTEKIFRPKCHLIFFFLGKIF